MTVVMILVNKITVIKIIVMLPNLRANIFVIILLFFFIINQCVMMISKVMKVKGDVISVIITSIKTHWYLRSVNKTIFLNCFGLCERCVLLC